MLCHLKCKYEDKNYINIHINSFAQFFAPCSTTDDKDPSITTVFLDVLNSFFELCVLIDIDLKFLLENFSIALIFTIMNIWIKPDYLYRVKELAF